jgi:exopolysaccharide production protein ExoZ
VARIQSFQVLRCVAAMMVLYLHGLNAATSTASGHLFSDHAPFRFVGAAGVDVFFVISGAIIFGLTRSAPPRTAATFLARRFRRIAPLYFFESLIWVVGARTLFGVVFRPTQLLTNFTFWPVWSGSIDAPALDAGWTLTFEMIFYAAMAVAISLGRNWAIGPLGYAVLLVASPLARNPVLQILGNPIFLEFLLGIVVIRSRAWLERRPVVSLALLASGTVALLAPNLGPNPFLFSETMGGRILTWIRLGACGMPAAAIVAGALGLERFVGAWAKPLIYLGDASYSIYLTNWVFFAFMRQTFVGSHVSPVLIAALGSAVALALGVLAYEAIERPVMRAFRTNGAQKPSPAPRLV